MNDAPAIEQKSRLRKGIDQEVSQSPVANHEKLKYISKTIPYDTWSWEIWNIPVLMWTSDLILLWKLLYPRGKHCFCFSTSSLSQGCGSGFGRIRVFWTHPDTVFKIRGDPVWSSIYDQRHNIVILYQLYWFLWRKKKVKGPDPVFFYSRSDPGDPNEPSFKLKSTWRAYLEHARFCPLDSILSHPNRC